MSVRVRVRVSVTVLCLQLWRCIFLMCPVFIYVWSKTGWKSVLYYTCVNACLGSMLYSHNVHDGFSTGAQRFDDDIRIMLGEQPSRCWSTCLKFLTPAILIVSSATHLYQFSNSPKQLRSTFGVGPCAKIPKGPRLRPPYINPAMSCTLAANCIRIYCSYGFHNSMNEFPNLFL